MNIKLLIVFLLISNGLHATRKKIFRKTRLQKGAVATHVVKSKPRPHGWASHVKIPIFEAKLTKKERR